MTTPIDPAILQEEADRRLALVIEALRRAAQEEAA